MAGLSVKALVQEFCRRTGLPVPSIVVGSTDKQVNQITALMNEEVEESTEQFTFQSLLFEKTFAAIAAENQGAVDTLAGEAVRYILNNILWNRNTKLPVFGPMSPQQYQQYKAQVVSGPFNQYRIRGGNLLMLPNPVAGHTLAMEFCALSAFTDSTGVTAKQYPTADTDLCRLADRHMLAGLRWRWKREKGLTYAEDKMRYDRILGNFIMKDGTKPVLNLNGGAATVTPGIFVPQGNWPV